MYIWGLRSASVRNPVRNSTLDGRFDSPFRFRLQLCPYTCELRSSRMMHCRSPYNYYGIMGKFINVGRYGTMGQYVRGTGDSEVLEYNLVLYKIAIRLTLETT